MDEKNEEVKAKVYIKIKDMKEGRLVIRRFSQENTTMNDIRSFVLRYEKKYGIKFDMVVLDYLDCLEPNKKTFDRTEAELQIVKSFLALSADFDIPAWSAIQSNRAGLDTDFVEASQSGGSIKRLQKAHFFMSVAKPKDMKEANLANIKILKARFAKDGQTFKDCRFDNDMVQVIINDADYDYRYSKNASNGKFSEEEVMGASDKIEKFNTMKKFATEFMHEDYEETSKEVVNESFKTESLVTDVSPDTVIEIMPIVDNDPETLNYMNLQPIIYDKIDLESLPDIDSEESDGGDIMARLNDMSRNQNIIKKDEDKK